MVTNLISWGKSIENINMVEFMVYVSLLLLEDLFKEADKSTNIYIQV